MTTRFPRTARVRARADFDRIFEHGRRVATPLLALHWQAGDAGPRLGLAVSRKVDPNAVGRNRIKRALRECFRLHRARFASGDYVIVARPPAAKCGGDELGQTLLSLLQRAGAMTAASAPALPLPPAPGTMPAAPVPPELASTKPDPTSH